jgi:FAD/FMN-containing dehydrogenase
MKRRHFLCSALAAGAAGLTGRHVCADVPALTTTRSEIWLRAADMEELRAGLHGQLLLPGAPEYDQARRIWNGAFDRRPALIARCADAADVQRAVRFAKEHQLLTAVRGGGHSISGQSACDRGFMIDLAPMQGVQVDPHARTARVQPGVLLGRFDAAAQRYGLATTAGTVSHTGVAGLTLGGGFGRLARKLGLTCDNLLSVQIVTADGALRTASEQENADLFWGVRGGGGNFGIVTSFEYRLHEIGPVLLGGAIVLPFDHPRATLSAIFDIATQASDELSTITTLARAPDGRCSLVVDTCYCGPVAAGEAAVAPLLKVAKVLAGQFAPAPYLKLQQRMDEVQAPGRRYYVKSGFVKRMSEALIDELAGRFEAAPALTAIPVAQIGGAISRVPVSATACWNREAEFDVLVQAAWEFPEHDDVKIAAARAAWKHVEKFTQGFYINTDTPDDAQRLRATFGGNYERLVGLKKKYDPTNLFRLNANIPPDA